MDLPSRLGVEEERVIGAVWCWWMLGQSSTNGYCSDVSRTWPVGGSFTPGQRAVYELVCRGAWTRVTLGRF